MPDEGAAGETVAESLARLIADQGPIPVEHFMAEANAAYYAGRDPFGRDGDFITAPEISQMFGELIGLWCADLWDRAGRPPSRYGELGPGRGTLAADALRAMRAGGLEPPVELVETSPVLREMQARTLGTARWHEAIETLPEDRPLLVVANEFFDALPVRQLITTDEGWRERCVDVREGRFVPVQGDPASLDGVPARFRFEPAGTILETSPTSTAMVAALASRIAAKGGAALIIDYGHARSAPGDTLQAVRAHRFADPWVDPGTQDLTAHVDFEALARAAARPGLSVFGPVEQGAWLHAMGIGHRAHHLAEAAPDRAVEVEAALQRLTGRDAMGSLFKVMALVASSWPVPAGF